MACGRDTKLFYEGVDITDDVDVVECIHKDASCGEADCLNIKVDHAEKWFAWGPKKNDTLRVTRNGYDTMTLYLNTVVPEDGAFRILATGTKSVAFPAKWQSWEGKTLSTIASACASECGMGMSFNGISGGILYPYMLRENVSAPVFLETLINREGGVLKAMGGKFVAIGVSYAQGLPPAHEIELDSKQMSARHIDRRDMLWSSVTISTPFGSGTASAGEGQARLITDIPVEDGAQALRWARGLLMIHNRQAEVLEIETDFNPGLTAMVRVDAKSSGEAGGQWIVHEVEHDFLNGRSKAKLYRCI